MSVPSSGRGQPTRHFSRPRNGGPPKGPSNVVLDNEWCWNDPHYAPILDFFQSLLPPSPHHLALIYHTPRKSTRQSSSSSSSPLFNQLVLAVTPTPDLYDHLDGKTILFLHRPWGLDRKRLPTTATMVLTSHQRLDERLTTGYNIPLIEALCGGKKLDEDGMGKIIGYKGDSTRKMGIVVRLPEASQHKTRDQWARVVKNEFNTTTTAQTHGGTNFDALSRHSQAKSIKYLACMNAYEPTIMERMLHTVNHAFPNPAFPGDVPLRRDSPPSCDDSNSNTDNDNNNNTDNTDNTTIDPAEILYITGEPKALGDQLAKQLDMPVVFVGHFEGEQWAIEYLAQRARDSGLFQHVRVVPSGPPVA